MALNHLKTLQKWSRMPSFMKKNRFEPVKIIFCKFSEFHPCLSPNPWFGLWGSLVWNMVTSQNGFKSLETLQKMIAYAFFHEKNRFKPVKLIFVSFSEFQPCLSPNPRFGLWGSLVWNMVTCQNGLKSLENFAKMIAYAFFHEKNRFKPVKTHFL